MQILKNEHKIIINYLIEKYNTVRSKIQKDIYENDLIEYIKVNEITECDEVLVSLSKNLEKVYLYIVEYNYKNKIKDFEDLINEIFKNENYQEYAFENPTLKEEIESELLNIKEIHKNYKISDELIAKLINTMKARVKDNNNEHAYNLPWAPEALISIELLNIFMKERLELYYLSPVSINNRFISTVKTEIIEQRTNEVWIEEDKDFIIKHKIEVFNIKERTILTDLLDFLPEMKSIKTGLCVNFPEKYIADRLRLILTYFEKSEVNSERKEIALNLINIFFNEYIFKHKTKSNTFEMCRQIIDEIQSNLEKTKKEENKLSLKPKQKETKVNTTVEKVEKPVHIVKKEIQKGNQINQQELKTSPTKSKVSYKNKKKKKTQ